VRQIRTYVPPYVQICRMATKKRQQSDIDAARAYWQDYKQSKRGRR
jgi:hypothetical protein